MNLQPGETWEVRLNGRSEDLRYLVESFNQPPIEFVEHERDGFLLRHERFQSCATSKEVEAIATEELLVLSGALRCVRGSAEQVRAAAVQKRRPDGGSDVFISMHETLSITMEIGDVIVTGGTPLYDLSPQPSRIAGIAEEAKKDDAVAKVMRLFARNPQSWSDLYRIHEVMEADLGGQHSLEQRAWVSKPQVRRFKQTANSASAAGDVARHGVENTQPPSAPMSSDEAEAYVNYVLREWLREKGL